MVNSTLKGSLEFNSFLIVDVGMNVQNSKAFFLFAMQNMVLGRPSQDFSSSYRQVLYGGLSLVIVSFIWSSSSGTYNSTKLSLLW